MPVERGNETILTPGAQLALRVLEHAKRAVEHRQPRRAPWRVGRQSDARAHQVGLARYLLGTGSWELGVECGAAGEERNDERGADAPCHATSCIGAAETVLRRPSR